MSRVEITEQDIHDALAASVAGNAPENARTLAEIQSMVAVGEKRLRRALGAIQAEGRLVVHKVMRRSLDGRPILVPAYTIIGKKRSKR